MGFTIKKIQWVDLSILLIALIVTILGIGNYGLYEPHEGHFAMVGQEMRWLGDPITPHLNGAPYLNKPPLLYWLISLSTAVFGMNEFAARLPVGLVGWLGIIISWKWTRQLWGINASRIAALMLSVTLGWFIFTHQILIDVVLGTLLLTSNYFLWRSLYRPQCWFYWLAAYICLGLCLLTKGLIGIVFPIVGCFCLVVVKGDWKVIDRIRLFPGILLAFALVLPWFIAVEQANPGFLHYFIFNEHLDRLFDRRFPPDYEVSKISALGYLGITALWCFPWILFLPSVIKSSWREWKQGFKESSSVLDKQRSDGILLLAIAAILPVVFFLPLSSRLIYYSIPALPPYIILCAGWYHHNYQLPVINYQLPLPIHPSSLPLQPSSFTLNPSSVGTVSKSSVQLLDREAKTQKVNVYGVIAIALGIVFCSAIFFFPLFVKFLPSAIAGTEIIVLIYLVVIALGLGWLVSGIAMLRQHRLFWLPLFLASILVYSSTVEGFTIYQDMRSSKQLVQQADACLNINTLWVFEGSRELGAAGAISYYLNQGKNYNPKLLDFSPTVGWKINNTNHVYRTVMVLSDGGKNRIPPQFPGSPPAYLITKQQLRSYWTSDRPVVFMTDFLRQHNDPSDPNDLNLFDDAGTPLQEIATRQLYGNAAAQKIWCLDSY
jgi:4-amino-4-deoxy-L-arabinose transferase-like glycosyltransferase